MQNFFTDLFKSIVPAGIDCGQTESTMCLGCDDDCLQTCVDYCNAHCSQLSHDETCNGTCKANCGGDCEGSCKTFAAAWK